VDLAATSLGIFAYITDDDPQALQSTLEIIRRAPQPGRRLHLPRHDRTPKGVLVAFDRHVAR
jgi:hypothetical protein